MNYAPGLAKALLNTHKGTVVRIRLQFTNAPEQLLAPLHQDIGAILLDHGSLESSFACSALSKASTSQPPLFINSAGTAVVPFLPNLSRPSGLVPLVVYPDGTTWEGPVGGDLRDVLLFAWTDPIISSMRSEGELSKFYGSGRWWETPTSVLVHRTHGLVGDCTRISHSCGSQCDKEP